VDGDLRAEHGEARAGGDEHDITDGDGIGQNQWPVKSDG
jgi:hypothetical protein